jgi:hypothetical protein
MNIQYLIDENLPPLYREQLLRRQPDLTVWMIGEPGVPSKSTLYHFSKVLTDIEILKSKTILSNIQSYH